jgi:DNA-binding GntR family transcriptional regulator
MYRYQFSWSSNRPHQALKEHDQICSAIEESDGELAEWLMKRHINNARNNILASMNNQKHPNLEKYNE